MTVYGGARKFEQAVIDSFEFLETTRGFRRQALQQADVDWTFVRYETDTLYVELTFVPPEYMPQMWLGRSGIDDVQGAHVLGADDLLQMDCCHDFQRNYSEPDRLEGAVAEFARLLAHCGSAFLAGDQQFLDGMRSRRDAHAAALQHAEAVNSRQRAIEQAWTAKDYGRVVQLISSMSGELTEIDRKRLHYAIKRA